MSSDDSNISNGPGRDQSDHRPWRPRPGWDGDDREHGREHPFISFRHMVDRKLAQVFQMLGKQTGSAAQHRGQQAPDETKSRLMGIFEQPPLYGRAMSQQAREQGEKHTREQRESSDDDPMNPLYRLLDRVQRGDSVDSYQFWKATSPYSPDWLRHDEEAPDGIRNCCHAMFNDLMAVHNGEAMTYRAPLDIRNPHDVEGFKRLLSSHLTRDQGMFTRSVDRKGEQWLSPFRLDGSWMGTGAISSIPSLLGLLGFPYEDSTAEPQASKQRDQDSHAVSEEDLYRRFLGIPNSQQEEEEFPRHKEEQHLEWQTNEIETSRRAQQIDEAAAKSRIIATVTQSYTTTNPDGSTRTVRRFKKTFADGSEESKEDISETPPKLPPQDSHLSQATTVSNDSSKKRSSGWFWN